MPLMELSQQTSNQILCDQKASQSRRRKSKRRESSSNLADLECRTLSVQKDHKVKKQRKTAPFGLPACRQRASLAVLGDDILEQILLRLRPRTIFRVCLTGRTIAAAVERSGLWRALFLQHSAVVSAQLSRLSIPNPVWKSLYRAMFLAHVQQKRTKKRKDGSKAAKSKKKVPWACPVPECTTEFENQGHLHQHLNKHFKTAWNHSRHYCPNFLCTRFFADSRRAVMHSKQTCPLRLEKRCRAWTCPSCSATFDFHAAYAAHYINGRCPSRGGGKRRKRSEGSDEPTAELGNAKMCCVRGSAGLVREAAGETEGSTTCNLEAVLKASAAAGRTDHVAVDVAVDVAEKKAAVLEVVTAEAPQILAMAGLGEKTEECARKVHGVSSVRGQWRAEVQVRGFRVNLGRYTHSAHAALAYDAGLLLVARHMQRRPGPRGFKLNFPGVVLPATITAAVGDFVTAYFAANPRARAGTTAASNQLSAARRRG